MSEDAIEMLRLRLAASHKVNWRQMGRNAALGLFFWTVCVLAIYGFITLAAACVRAIR